MKIKREKLWNAYSKYWADYEFINGLITQGAKAKLIGIGRTHLYNILAGTREPGGNSLKKICDRIGSKVDDYLE